MSDSFGTVWTVACQASLSVEFSRQENWSGFFFLRGIFLTQRSNPCLLHWQVNSLPLGHQGTSVSFTQRQIKGSASSSSYNEIVNLSPVFFSNLFFFFFFLNKGEHKQSLFLLANWRAELYTFDLIFRAEILLILDTFAVFFPPFLFH